MSSTSPRKRRTSQTPPTSSGTAALREAIAKAKSPQDIRQVQNLLDECFLDELIESRAYELLTKGNAMRLRTFTSQDESLRQLRELEVRLNGIEAQGRAEANMTRQHAQVGPKVVRLL